MTYEYLPALYACVITGNGQRARRLARRLFWSYNLPSHVLSPRNDLLSRVTPWIIHHNLPAQASDNIRALALRDLCTDLQACDRQPILLLDENAERMLSQESIASLENCYLVCHERDLDALFSAATSLAQGDMTV